MSASSTNVQYLLGDLYTALGDDGSSIVTAMIARAQAFVDGYTNSSTGTLVDNAVEDFAALYILQRMVAGSSSANQINIGEITIGEKQIQEQITELRRQGYEKLKMVNRDNRFRLTERINT